MIMVCAEPCTATLYSIDLGDKGRALLLFFVLFFFSIKDDNQQFKKTQINSEIIKNSSDEFQALYTSKFYQCIMHLSSLLKLLYMPSLLNKNSSFHQAIGINRSRTNTGETAILISV